MKFGSMAVAALVVCSMVPAVVTARAILGVDLGSLYMKVALVQSGSPLEIVTNLHSKRKTEQMVLFDNNQRFYGADAAALLARKSQKTPAAMSVLLGRDDQHPVVQVSSSLVDEERSTREREGCWERLANFTLFSLTNILFYLLYYLFPSFTLSFQLYRSSQNVTIL